MTQSLLILLLIAMFININYIQFQQDYVNQIYYILINLSSILKLFYVFYSSLWFFSFSHIRFSLIFYYLFFHFFYFLSLFLFRICYLQLQIFIYNIVIFKQNMIGWLSKCWGGMGVTTEFERARILSTYADWTVPPQQSLNIVLQTFKGTNPEMNAESAINSFFTHLQQDDERRNAAFLLKHLLILDLTVQQRVFLTKIGIYHNNNFLYMETGGNQLISSSVKDLIASYYEYIRAKAKLYSTQAMQIVNKQMRQNFLQSINPISMLNQINICFKVQNSILMVSDSFMNGNKSPQLIQLIFSSLLKTYLFCFSIVSQALKAFINRIPTLSKYDLQYLSKLANYFSKDYTRNLLLFIQRNKLIDNFKTLKYNQLIVLDDKIVSIIDNKLRQIQQDNAECPELVPLPLELTPNLIVEKILQNEINAQRGSDVITRHRRKKLEPLRGMTGEDEPESCFTDYQNFYSQNFIVEEQRNASSEKMSSSKKSTSKNESKISEKSRKIYSKLSFSDGLGVPGLRKQLSLEQSKKFNKHTWQGWQNVYCT